MPRRLAFQRWHFPGSDLENGLGTDPGSFIALGVSCVLVDLSEMILDQPCQIRWGIRKQSWVPGSAAAGWLPSR